LTGAAKFLEYTKGAKAVGHSLSDVSFYTRKAGQVGSRELVGKFRRQQFTEIIDGAKSVCFDDLSQLPVEGSHPTSTSTSLWIVTLVLRDRDEHHIQGKRWVIE